MCVRVYANVSHYDACQEKNIFRQIFGMISKRFIKLTAPVLMIVALYLLGPKPATPVYDMTLPAVPAEAVALEQYVAANEAAHKVRPNNEARVVWNDSTRKKTPYAVVYLHGFTASQMEGDPVHKRFAKALGCNLYLARLADHGLDTTDALINMTPDRLWASAKQALAIGKQLGDKVILVSCSTGSTLALKLAAEFPQDVDALINLSPNIAINNGAAFLLNGPWGLYIARAVMGGKYSGSEEAAPTERSQYWYTLYRLEGAVQLEELIETTMLPETFEKIHQPSLTLYYYKNEKEQDPEVKVSAMLEMNEELATPDSLKQAVAIPEAGVHVIASGLRSEAVDKVYNTMLTFAHDKLGINQSEWSVSMNAN
jgi:pimeloyl-ACP methyl ester carboxylesterase